MRCINEKKNDLTFFFLVRLGSKNKTIKTDLNPGESATSSRFRSYWLVLFAFLFAFWLPVRLYNSGGHILFISLFRFLGPGAPDRVK